jgi:catechol 2,3-dioxygenase-like lactoylglutathione lyase family enzyme
VRRLRQRGASDGIAHDRDAPQFNVDRSCKEMAMLNNVDASANLAVKDLAAARRFYEGTLGLKEVGTEGNDFVAYRSGNTTVNVYRSDYAGSNKATAVTWNVGDELESTVRDLAAKGVKFEHYDMPGLKRRGDVYEGHGMKVAWFKDPDGNILNLVSG